MKYSELLRLNNDLKLKVKNFETFNIKILSNIMVSYIKNILEYNLRSNGLNPTMKFGDYDNIIQNSSEVQKEDIVIIFWELSNLIDGLQYKILNFSNEEYHFLCERIKNEIHLTLKNLSNNSIVIFNKFTSTPFTLYNLKSTILDRLAEDLNLYLKQIKPDNCFIVDLDKIYAQISVGKSINMRDYYSSKTLYNTIFFEAYSEYILPVILSKKGKIIKAVILDCDNTLWQGILGEDGIDKIKMTAAMKASPYEEVQCILKSLVKKGVILGLNSKNNLDDVIEVIMNHPDMIINDNDIIIKKINWKDKVSNLKEISHELNIGLDSFIFIDDSDFEINLVNEQLPEVKLIHVPLNEIYNYADKIRKEFRIFNVYSETTEDQEKVKQYQAQLERKVNINQFNNIDEYLDSLNIEIKVNKNTYDDIIRVAQLTQKTNQFNLTSKRYTEQDIKNFINNGSIVLNINVSDNFGDSGITGLAIIKIDNVAYIDTFLLSCRVLGRKIEYKFIYYILNLLQKMGITKVVAIYQKTNKNEQVKEFYDQVGFNIISDDGLIKTYNLDLRNFNNKDINYIKILK